MAVGTDAQFRRYLRNNWVRIKVRPLPGRGEPPTESGKGRLLQNERYEALGINYGKENPETFPDVEKLEIHVHGTHRVHWEDLAGATTNLPVID